MKLVIFPNDVLTAPTELITEFNENLSKIIEEMTTIMIQHNGLGLSAPQIGLSKQLFIIKTQKGEIVEFINPIIVETDGKVLMTEGCLSSPNIYLPIERPESVVIKYLDKIGSERTSFAEGLEARCILHEFDHLNQKFYFDYVNRHMRKQAIRALRGSLK